LLLFPVFETGGVSMAIRSAQNYRNLRKKGFTIRTTIDCILATFCIENGHELLHNDRDFDVFEQHLDLKVRHP
jgi:predicted nucleic acid-binding protein